MILSQIRDILKKFWDTFSKYRVNYDLQILNYDGHLKAQVTVSKFWDIISNFEIRFKIFSRISSYHNYGNLELLFQSSSYLSQSLSNRQRAGVSTATDTVMSSLMLMGQKTERDFGWFIVLLNNLHIERFWISLS